MWWVLMFEWMWSRRKRPNGCQWHRLPLLAAALMEEIQLSFGLLLLENEIQYTTIQFNTQELLVSYIINSNGIDTEKDQDESDRTEAMGIWKPILCRR
jgi:hypothetical protein